MNKYPATVVQMAMKYCVKIGQKIWGGGIPPLILAMAFFGATDLVAQNTTSGEGNHTGAGTGGGQGNGQGSGQDNFGGNPHVVTLAPAGTCDCTGPGQDICPPEAKFLPAQSDLPPATMLPGATANVILAFANCSATTNDPTNETWTDTAGYVLKASPAVDATLWTASYVPLPSNNPCVYGPCAIYPPGSMVIFNFTVTAPMVAGSSAAPNNYNFGWSMRRETTTVQRYIGETTTRTVGVVKNATVMADICMNACLVPPPPGFPPCTIQADISGNLPASAAIQQCIDNTEPGGTLELPLGMYLLDSQVTINKPMTLRTAGTAGSTDGCWTPYPSITKCAVLQAAPGTSAFFGFFQVFDSTAPGGYVENVHIDHILIDGNRRQRDVNPLRQNCKDGNHFVAWNSNFNCTNCSLGYSAFINAVCGVGLRFDADSGSGSVADIHDNVFYGNGKHDDNLMWADGFGYLGDGGSITNNFAADNSDVDMIFPGGLFTRSLNRTISGNTVLHSRQASFAAMMLHTFNDPINFGNFRGDLVSGNLIDCDANLHYCDHGIMVGGRPWGGCWGPYQGSNCVVSLMLDNALFHPIEPNAVIPPNPDTCSYNIYGGIVTGNTVMNARQGINVDGAGASSMTSGPNCAQDTPGYPTSVFNNTVSGEVMANTIFQCNPPSPGIVRAVTQQVNISDFYNAVVLGGDNSLVSTNTFFPTVPPQPQPNTPSYYCP